MVPILSLGRSRERMHGEEVEGGIRKISDALIEQRGLDGYLIEEMNLSFSDLASSCATTSMILRGYLASPEWLQGVIISIGALAQTVDEEGDPNPEILEPVVEALISQGFQTALLKQAAARIAGIRKSGGMGEVG